MPIRSIVVLTLVLLAACSSRTPDDVWAVRGPRSGGMVDVAGTASRNLFAVSDIYSFYPDGSVSEIEDGDLRTLRKKNGHYDAATKTIRLYGAKNEEVAVQLVIPRKGNGFHAIATPIGSVPESRITFSVVGYVKTKFNPRLTPDVVIPLDGSVAGIRRFDVPLSIRALPDAKNKVGCMLMEIWIPTETQSGLHQGQVTVLEGDKEIATFDIELTVFPFSLPDRPTYRLDYLSYGSPLTALKSLGVSDYRMPDGGTDLKTPDEVIKIEHQAYALASDNRAYLNILPYSSQRGSPRFAYPVRGTGKAARIVSYEGFDKRFGSILSGRVGKYKVPPACFTLCFNVNYPYTMQGDPARQFDFTQYRDTIPTGPGERRDLAVFEQTYRAIAQQTMRHFSEKGWQQTAFEVYYNQKANRDRNRVPWKLDEPTTGSDYHGLRYLFKVAKWAFQGARDEHVNIVTRLDLGHWECDRFVTLAGKSTRCYKGKEYNSHHAQQLLQPVVDRWVVSVSHSNAARHLIPEYNTSDVMFDTYGTSGVGSRHFGEFAGLCWRHAYLGVEGKVIYKLSPYSPMDVEDQSIYLSGAGLGFKGFLASRRVKIWRNSVNDYDYLMLAGKKDPPALRRLLRQVIKIGPHSDEKYRERSKATSVYFTNNVEDILQAKLVAAGIITGEDYGGKIQGFSRRYSPNQSKDQIVGYD